MAVELGELLQAAEAAERFHAGELNPASRHSPLREQLKNKEDKLIAKRFEVQRLRQAMSEKTLQARELDKQERTNKMMDLRSRAALRAGIMQNRALFVGQQQGMVQSSLQQHKAEVAAWRFQNIRNDHERLERAETRRLQSQSSERKARKKKSDSAKRIRADRQDRSPKQEEQLDGQRKNRKRSPSVTTLLKREVKHSEVRKSPTLSGDTHSEVKSQIKLSRVKLDPVAHVTSLAATVADADSNDVGDPAPAMYKGARDPSFMTGLEEKAGDEVIIFGHVDPIPFLKSPRSIDFSSNTARVLCQIAYAAAGVEQPHNLQKKPKVLKFKDSNRLLPEDRQINKEGSTTVSKVGSSPIRKRVLIEESSKASSAALARRNEGLSDLGMPKSLIVKKAGSPMKQTKATAEHEQSTLIAGRTDISHHYTGPKDLSILLHVPLDKPSAAMPWKDVKPNMEPKSQAKKKELMMLVADPVHPRIEVGVSQRS